MKFKIKKKTKVNIIVAYNLGKVIVNKSKNILIKLMYFPVICLQFEYIFINFLCCILLYVVQ